MIDTKTKITIVPNSTSIYYESYHAKLFCFKITVLCIILNSPFIKSDHK